MCNALRSCCYEQVERQVEIKGNACAKKEQHTNHLIYQAVPIKLYLIETKRAVVIRIGSDTQVYRLRYQLHVQG
ncbi:MAG: hypothetical protein CV090_05450 [Nitrospira sp. WS238]|nr:hypothetical protein [Nitrospira sp. WS238]